LNLKIKGRLFRGVTRGGLAGSLVVISVLLAGCEQDSAAGIPTEGPEVIVKRFYGYISEAKIKGGGSPAREAFKLISADRSRLVVEQFLEVIKKYPPGFSVEVGKVEIDGTHAVVDISYKMPSMFGSGYTMNEVIPLNVDTATNTWKVDFTGETHGMNREATLEAARAGQLNIAGKGRKL
jgi:hypothetical protein